MSLNIDTQKSIDALMDELKLVIRVAPDDKVEILSYILAELQSVMDRRIF